MVDSGKPTCEDGEDHRGAGALGGEALRRVHLDDPRPHRLDDAPAADVGAEPRSRRAAETITQVGTIGVGADAAVGDERQEDDAHRLLGVVGAVREREQAAGDDLPEPEAARHRARAAPPDDPVGDQDRDAGDDERDDRGHQARDRRPSR